MKPLLRVLSALVFPLMFFLIGCMSAEEDSVPTDPSGAGDDWYKLVSYSIQIETPSFINIMFQVLGNDGVGVTDLLRDDLEVLEDGSPISPTESALNIRKRDVIPYALKTVIAIDNSPSVAPNLSDIKSAAVSLVQKIVDKQEFAVIVFSETITVIQEFTSNVGQLTAAIQSIPQGYGTTDLFGAVITGVGMWEDRYDTHSIEQGFLIVLTDGSDEAGWHTLSEARYIRGSKRIYTIGLGNEIDVTALEELGNAGFYSLENVEDLAPQFAVIQRYMASFTNSFYWLNYMSPKRGVGYHTLLLRILNNSNMGLGAEIAGSFSSDGFYGMPRGVFINATDERHFGIDSLAFHLQQTVDTLTVQSFMVEKVPEYQWLSSDETIVTVEAIEIDGSTALVKKTGYGEVYITVEDTRNDLSKMLHVSIPNHIPYAPSNVSAEAVSPSQIDVIWIDNSNNEDGFRIERKTGAGGQWSQIQQVTANLESYQDTGLTSNTLYFYRVRAFNVVGTSAYSNETSTTTMDVLPTAPSDLEADAISSSQVILTWEDNSNNEDGFRIERKTGVEGQWAEINQVSVDTSAFSDSGLEANTSYIYRVRAYNRVGNSAYSNETSTTTIDVPPTAPSALEAEAVNSTQINLTWNDNSNDEDGFRIERKTGAGGSYSQIVQTASGATSYQNTGLTANTIYYYHVRAFNNSGGNSGYSNEISATTNQSVPAAPSGLRASAVSSSRIDLQWNDNSNNEDGFRIERKTGAGGAYAQIAQTAVGAASYQNTGLTANTTYYYRVYAFIGGLNSGYSNEISATTNQAPPAAPSHLEAEAVSFSQIKLSWTDNSNNEDGFIIERRLQDEDWAEINRTRPDDSTYTDVGLEGDIYYFYRVCAFNQEGGSEYSNVASGIIYRDLVMLSYDNGNLSNFLTLPESNGFADKYYNVRFTPPAAPFSVNSVHIGLFDLFGEMGTPGMRVFVWQSGRQFGEPGYPMEFLDSLDIPFEDLQFGNEEPVFNVIDLTPLAIQFDGITDFHIGVDIIADEDNDTLAVYVDNGLSPSTRSSFYSATEERWYKMDDEGAYDAPFNFAIRAVVEVVGQEGDLVILDNSLSQPTKVAQRSSNPGKKENTIKPANHRVVRSVFQRK